MATTTVGANLTAKRPTHFRRFLNEKLANPGKKNIDKVSSTKFFTKAGAPVASTNADSPGSNNSWVWDLTNSDLYLVYNYTDADTFDVTKIVD